MQKITETLISRKNLLLKWQKNLEHSLLKVPEGSLRVCKHHNRTQYYQRTSPKDFNGKYIPKENYLLVKQLAQKDYALKTLAVLNKEILAIDKFLTLYPKNNAEELYLSLHPERQKLITPIYESDDDYIKHWESYTYSGKDFDELSSPLYTQKGERVRSKSEIIIADLLHKHNIPYRYECPIYLSSFGKIYPDFMTLNIRSRKEIIWEHFGMMDDPIYLEGALKKIATYEQNGFFPGDNLILTYESKNNPINTKILLLIIEKFLL